MTFWVYGISTFAFFIGVFIILKFKKWQLGGWITCLSLAIFAGASINIRNLISVDDAFKYEVTQQVSAISNEIGNVKIQLTQSMVVTQQISQTVNLVTEVKKEVADIREMVDELYKRTRIEQIQSTDTNRMWFLQKKDGAHVTVMRLEQPPIPQSLSALAFHGDSPSIPILPLSMNFYRNIITVVWLPSATKYQNMSYNVTYVVDPNSSNVYDKVEIHDDILTLDDQLDVTFK